MGSVVDELRPRDLVDFAIWGIANSDSADTPVEEIGAKKCGIDIIWLENFLIKGL